MGARRFERDGVGRSVFYDNGLRYTAVFIWMNSHREHREIIIFIRVWSRASSGARKIVVVGFRWFYHRLTSAAPPAQRLVSTACE